MNYYKILEIDNNTSEEISSLKKKIHNLHIKKDKLLDLNIEGNISNKEFFEKNNLFNKKINNLTKELKKIKNNRKTYIINDKIKELESSLNSKVFSNSTTNQIVSHLLDYIEASKIDDNKILLNIYLTYNQHINLEPIITNKYEFKRGYDTTSTKRYKVTYLVNCYFNK